MLEGIPHQAARYFGDGWPLPIVRPVHQPSEIDYPPVRLMVFFTSLPMRREMPLSSVVVAWFQREQIPVPDQAGQIASEALDRERLALDNET